MFSGEGLLGLPHKIPGIVPTWAQWPCCGLSPRPAWPLTAVDEAIHVTARPWAGYGPWRLAWDLVPQEEIEFCFFVEHQRRTPGVYQEVYGSSCVATTAVTLQGLPHSAQLRARSFVWLSLWPIRPVVWSGWSKALPSWMGTCWAGCHVEHRARSSQLGLVEAGSRIWLVARASSGVGEGW